MATELPRPSQDLTATVAVVSHQIGEVKTAIENLHRENTRRLDDHGQRIGALEEAQIRADEREQTEERLRAVLKEERGDAARERHDEAALSLNRWQLILALLTLIGPIAYIVSTVH